MCPKIEKATDNQWLLSGWQDSNLRPPHPKCGAIPGYATPRKGITFVFVWHKYTAKNIFVKINFKKHAKTLIQRTLQYIQHPLNNFLKIFSQKVL